MTNEELKAWLTLLGYTAAKNILNKKSWRMISDNITITWFEPFKHFGIQTNLLSINYMNVETPDEVIKVLGIERTKYEH